jgi:hypothetical protein
MQDEPNCCFSDTKQILSLLVKNKPDRLQISYNAPHATIANYVIILSGREPLEDQTSAKKPAKNRASNENYLSPSASFVPGFNFEHGHPGSCP